MESSSQAGLVNQPVQQNLESILGNQNQQETQNSESSQSRERGDNSFYKKVLKYAKKVGKFLLYSTVLSLGFTGLFYTFPALVKPLVGAYLSYRGISMPVETAMQYAGGPAGIGFRLGFGITTAYYIIKGIYNGVKSLYQRIKKKLSRNSN